jgi:hypothetical protein
MNEHSDALAHIRGRLSARVGGITASPSSLQAKTTIGGLTPLTRG